MGMPKSVTKMTKSGGKVQVQFTSNVDRCNYTIQELTKAALRDSGKIIMKHLSQEAPKRTGNLRKSFAAWNRNANGEQIMQIGTYYSRKKAEAKHKGYAPYLHLVLFPHKDRAGNMTRGDNFFQRIVEENIDTIREAQGKYLSAIENENEAIALAEAEEKEPEEF